MIHKLLVVTNMALKIMRVQIAIWDQFLHDCFTI